MTQCLEKSGDVSFVYLSESEMLGLLLICHDVFDWFDALITTNYANCRVSDFRVHRQMRGEAVKVDEKRVQTNTRSRKKIRI